MNTYRFMFPIVVLAFACGCLSFDAAAVVLQNEAASPSFMIVAGVSALQDMCAVVENGGPCIARHAAACMKVACWICGLKAR